VAAVIVVLDEGGDLRLELAGQMVVFQRDAVLQRLMPPLNFALGLRVAGRAVDVLDAMLAKPSSEISSKVTQAINSSRIRR